MIRKLAFVGAATLAVLAIAGLGIFGPKKPDVKIPQAYNPPVVDMTEAETEAWMDSVRAAGYNVDVQVTGHAWDRHASEATNAVRCLTNNGTTIVLSEKNSRNLHLLCVDPKTGEAWVVIIEKIRRYADTLQNATSRMITAFKLTDVTVEQYVTWETAIKSIVIRLSFKAGELFFKP
jgi:hypothetical protein